MINKSKYLVVFRAEAIPVCEKHRKLLERVTAEKPLKIEFIENPYTEADCKICRSHQQSEDK